MTAYRNNFVVIPQKAVGGSSGDSAKLYEPVMVAHELVTNNDGDIVMGEVQNVA